MKKIIVISGKVQGVGFRYWLQRLATSRGIFGWVRNLNAGQVEALLVGEEAVIHELIEECKIGPPNSFVEQIKVHDTEVEYLEKSFEIIPTR